MISIIIPIYNSEKTIKRCIESLLYQTYKDIEIVCVFDGSIDDSLNIAKECAVLDNRVKIIIKENQGVSATRNAGINAAIGEYLMFIDSDDYADKFMCEKLVKAVEKEDSDMVICGYHHIFLEKDYIKVPNYSKSYNISELDKVFLDLYSNGFLNMPWNKLFKREKIESLFDNRLSLGEDLLFNLDYMKRINKVTVLKEPLIYYIQNNGQDNLSAKKRKDKYQIAVKLCETVKKFAFDYIYINIDDKTIKEVNNVVYKRLILEFLDEIEGMPYDEHVTKTECIDKIGIYANDAYIIEANNNVKIQQIDYRIINFFFKLKCKNIVYILACMRKILMSVVRR